MKIFKNTLKTAFWGLACMTSLTAIAQDKPDKFSFCFDDRFIANDEIDLVDVDSVSFEKNYMKRFKLYKGSVRKLTTAYRTGGKYVLGDGPRSLIKPNQYSTIDFTKETSKWCFQRSMESEHFICFWEKGLNLVNNTVSLGGHSINVKTMLNRAETVWQSYVEDLGFLVPGQSTTDSYKICMFIVNQTDWRADGSGEDGTAYYYSGTTKNSKSVKVGLFHCNPWAASAEGGHTMAHEVGHVFQYLVCADLGTSHGWGWGLGDGGSGGNCWWECCAQWQAFQVYPATTFSNYRYNEYVTSAYKNLLHEDYRYANYFIQNYWCELFGKDFIGKLWRASTRPEDPVQTYLRINNQTTDDFNKMIFDYACRAITWDIDWLRDKGKNYQNSFSTTLNHVAGTENTYIVAPECTPQNYGFNIIQLKGFTPGQTVKVNFKGVAGAEGYRSINTDKAGWRYGFVAQSTDGSRTYGDMHSDKEGTAELTLPEQTAKAWLVVTGAPTEHWRHPWDDNAENDEQWPYTVELTGCSAMGTTREYGDYPEDYQRKDTTVVIDAELARANDYSSVRVQYDMDAISQALGVSTKQMKAVKCSASSKGVQGTIDFVGVNANGTYRYGTTTSTSSATCFGHWFSTAGNVCGYDGSAAIFAEMYPDKYGCYVGQYPNRLTAGNTYTIRQAFVYTHTDGKQYTATMLVRLKIK